MKLVRIGPRGSETPGILLDDGTVADASRIVRDYDAAFFAEVNLSELAARSQSLPRLSVDPATRFGPPTAQPGKIICVGLNYVDHASETAQVAPVEPILFLKASDTWQGPNDAVVIPPGSSKTDWEVELGVVIKDECRYICEHDDPLQYVAGYLVCNDLSERAFQLERGGQWDKGKSCETFNPAGPWLVTPDEVGDPQAIDLWLSVNGEQKQSASTRDMIFGVAELIRYISWFMVLRPGDVINTGTPAGVALGSPNGAYLRAGDVLELGATGMGEHRYTCIGASPSGAIA